jgi:hypothetical protein
VEAIGRCKGCGVWIIAAYGFCRTCDKINVPNERRSSDAEANQGRVTMSAAIERSQAKN